MDGQREPAGEEAGNEREVVRDLISDAELTDPELDQFGHRTIVDGIAGIIDNREHDRPLNIALYGPWGSGKSSIAAMLEARFAGVPEVAFVRRTAARGGRSGARHRAWAVPSMVMSTRLPRWAWLLVLPTLVAALLLMHGLDAPTGDHHPEPASVSASVVDEGPGVDSVPGEHDHCADCMAGHVMAACVAVITAIGGVGLVRRRLARGTMAARVTLVGDWVQSLVGVARPPDPAWVRLSVMRC